VPPLLNPDRNGLPLLALLLAPIIFPITLAVMLAILVPIGCWNASVYAMLWVRWKCFGVQIPRIAIEATDNRASE
jgi:hypothetical protein